MAILKKEVSKQFLKFCLIGLESTVLNYLVFLTMFYFISINYLVSAGTGFVSGVFLGFIFNRLYTFNSKEKSISTIPGYLLVYLFSLVFSLIALKFLSESIMINPLVSNALLIPITTVMNFFGTKIFVFKNKKW
ncbi:GtrA-like protein [uncultured archaeon]|nr:GtrA-like protein [uncultured archaeon]